MLTTRLLEGPGQPGEGAVAFEDGEDGAGLAEVVVGVEGGAGAAVGPVHEAEFDVALEHADGAAGVLRQFGDGVGALGHGPFSRYAGIAITA